MGAAAGTRPGVNLMHLDALAAVDEESPFHGPARDWLETALCIEHGLRIAGADSDFARFTEIGWINPVATP